MTIWKYQIKPETTLSIPTGGKVLSVQMQHDEPHIWVLVDPTAKQEERRFVVHGTGHKFDATGLEFIDTFQIAGGVLVFHLFEAK